MATITVDDFEDVGDGRVRVWTRTALGNRADIVIGRHLFGSATMYQLLSVAASRVDSKASALDARRGKSDQDPT